MRGAAALIALAALSGCDLSMTRQPRHQAQSSPTLWPDGPAVAPPPPGSLAEDMPAQQAALMNPPHLTPALIARGRDRYTIYCAPCHGAAGDGDGMVVQRGFPHPPSYHEPRLVNATPAHIVDVITHGYGIMYSFDARVSPRDRWAIAAYVKALQRARLDQRPPA